MLVVRLAFVGLTLLVSAPALAAATISVSPNGPNPTIQSGVDAAGPGDTVSIKSGTYVENVVVPAGKDGLRLVAAGKVVIDARPQGAVETGPCVLLESHEVTLQGLRLVNAAGGLGGAISGLDVDGTRVLKCSFANAKLAGVLINGDDTSVVGCVFEQSLGLSLAGFSVFLAGERAIVDRCRFSGAAGVFVEGDDARVTRNTASRGPLIGVAVFGDRCQIVQNRIERIGPSKGSAFGIFVEGNDLVVDRNVIDRVCGGGILVSGNGATVSRNRIAGTDEWAAEVVGDDAVVLLNKITGGTGGGLDIEGAAPRIERNTITGGTRGLAITQADGMQVLRNTLRDIWCFTVITVSVTDGGRIERNSVSDVSGDGLSLAGSTSDLMVEMNTIQRTAFGHAMEVDGSGHTLRGNTIKQAGGDGILLEGTVTTVEENRVDGCGEDGIDAESDGIGLHQLRDNVVTRCGAEGVELDSIDGVAERNTSRGNRIDFAVSSTPLLFADNTSQDGTDVDPPAPEIDRAP